MLFGRTDRSHLASLPPIKQRRRLHRPTLCPQHTSVRRFCLHTIVHTLLRNILRYSSVVPCSRYSYSVPGTVTLFQVQLHVTCSMSHFTLYGTNATHATCSMFQFFEPLLVTRQTQCSMFHIRIFCLRHIPRDGCSHVLITNMLVNLREVTGQSRRPHRFRLNFRTKCPFS